MNYELRFFSVIQLLFFRVNQYVKERFILLRNDVRRSRLLFVRSSEHFKRFNNFFLFGFVRVVFYLIDLVVDIL